MNHPEHIVRTLDSFLVQPTRLILYGRAALSLGFSNPLPPFQATMDVDAILPTGEIANIEADDSFWNAVEKTNVQLEPNGLYITHLFLDDQVILSNGWLERIVHIPAPELQFLTLFRPSTEDLILTKMMRVDPQDRQDIQFLLAQMQEHSRGIIPTLDRAIIPPIPEIDSAFQINRAWLLEQLQS